MKKLLQIFFLFILLLTFTSKNNFAQEKISATFEASPEGKVFIYYQLNGDPNKEYDVSVVLKRTSVPSFEVVPSDLSGNVGVGKFAGGKKTIIWNLKPEEKNILNGDDFYFVVTADEVKEGGGIPWYVYVGGAALAGGAAVLLLTKKSDDNNGGGGASNELPNPPGRP